MEECLADLEWIPAKGYVLLITEAFGVIPDEEEEYETLLEVLSDAGEAWSKGHTADGRRAPFHVFFAVSQLEKSRRKHWGLKELPLNEQQIGGGKPRTTRPAKGSSRNK